MCSTQYIIYINVYIAVWIEKRETSGKQKKIPKNVSAKALYEGEGELFIYYYYVHLCVTTKIDVPIYLQPACRYYYIGASIYELIY